MSTTKQVTVKKSNTPKMRFNEFTDVWKLSKLEDLLLNYRLGGNYENSEAETGTPLIKMGNLGRGSIVLDKIQYVPENEQLDNKDKIEFGDLFFNTRNTLELVGKVAIWRNELPLAYYNSNLMYLKFEDNFFMNYRLNSFQGIKSLRRLATGTTSVAAIYTKDLLKVKLAIPSLPEQQKIAAFLSAVDEKIQQLTRKKELLEQYKKGVMQQLFSGKLRFKPAPGEVPGDANNKPYPKWEEKKLGDVIKLQGGYAFKSNLFRTEGVPVIRISNISNEHNYIELNNIVYYDEIEKPENFTIKKGDLLIAMSGATTGKSCIYNLPYDSYLNQRVGLFKSINRSLYYDFLIQFVFSEVFKKQLDAVLVAGAQPNVSGSDIESFKFPLPSFEEQQKIASFLTALDAKIESVSQQIAQTQTFKKGLLQQMFC